MEVLPILTFHCYNTLKFLCVFDFDYLHWIRMMMCAILYISITLINFFLFYFKSSSILVIGFFLMPCIKIGKYKILFKTIILLILIFHCITLINKYYYILIIFTGYWISFSFIDWRNIVRVRYIVFIVHWSRRFFGEFSFEYSAITINVLWRNLNQNRNDS